MSDKKKCPFCEAIALQRFIEEHHSKPAGFGMALSAALVSYAVVNGRKCGRTTDYMKDGKGYSKTDYIDILQRLKTALKAAGFYAITIDAETYEQDTGYYHVPVEIKYMEV